LPGPVRRPDGDRRSFGAAILASLVLSPLVWLHYYVVLIAIVALASPTFGPLWLLPALAFWPFADDHSQLWVSAWVWAVMTAAALIAIARPAGARLARSGAYSSRGTHAGGLNQ
jgi:hypothetical protein